MGQASGLLQLQDERNILLGPGVVWFGLPYVNLGQVKGDVSFNYTLRPYDVVAGNPLVLLRRFTLEERVNMTIPLLEIEASSMALAFRNFSSGASTVTGAASGGGTLYSQTFGGSSATPFSQFLFQHPTPEGGYINIYGYQVYPPLEMRLPFPEQRETIFDATFEFRHNIGSAPGNQLGKVDVFIVPLT